MCGRDELQAWQRPGADDWTANRRLFSLAALGALVGCASPAAPVGGSSLVEEWVRIPTADGTMEAFFVRPAQGRHPAVLTWPDIAGAREAYLLMARRRAAEGHAVLVAHNYYRHAASPPFKGGPDYMAQGGGDKFRPWIAALSADAIGRDAKALIAWLDGRREVDTSRGVGTDGYCLGGAHVVWTAAAVPERVRAVASLHGWQLVTDKPDSPHRLLAKTQARYLFAIGRNDDEKTPEEKDRLRAAAAAAGRPAEVEVYAANHGWMVPDSQVYDAAQAERGWGRMREMFARM